MHEAPSPDVAAIKAGIALIACGAPIVELRAIASRPRKRISAGYFDKEHIDDMAKEAARLNSTGAQVYQSLNPCVPDLLGRAANRVIDGAERTTQDADIARRQLLLIDVDPCRPAETSATKAQKESATTVMRAAVAAMADYEARPALKVDSGNGWHSHYRIETPNDERARDTIKRILEALARGCNTVEAKIDTSVFNAARIVKIPGTVAKKGDSTPAQPHRLSRVIASDSAIPPLSLADLERIAGGLESRWPSPARSTISAQSSRPAGIGARFDLSGFIGRHGIEVHREDDRDGWHRWLLRSCPFNREHVNGEAMLSQAASGALAFKCLHNSCADRSWSDVRELFEGHRAIPNRTPVEAPQATQAGEFTPTYAPVTARPLEAEKRSWPGPLDEAALIGLAGDIVRTIQPRTEADDAAILLQTLVAFGALVGRTHHVRIEGDRHYAHLFGLVVGDTSNARKGTSWGRVREIFSGIPTWPPVVDGLSSGEGLKYAVRDAVTKPAKDGSGDQVVDDGVSDKRLLVVESEFAQVLRQGARAGNTLSTTIRAAWDSGRLATLTRNDPITATGAHVCIVGHITAEELKAELTQTDTANGFANRFLFMCAKKSKMLPRGGGAIPPDELDALRRRIADAVARAGLLREVEWTDAAWAVWDRVYPRLSTGSGGLFGAVTARGAPQCVRLALTYALMDEADRIDAPHVLAALAVWERCEESARWIFGSALGDRVADEILRALRVAGNAGIARTKINHLFKGHETADRINAALNVLAEKQLARRVDTESTGGRPAEVWEAA